ncbi:MAG: response regulator transcription factor [Acidimicrobiia bacterium]
MTAPPAHILVVEDDAVYQRYLVSLLEREQYRVSAVFEAEEALRVLARDPPDLIVVDVELPGMSGLELLNRVRATEPVPVPVVIVSGHDSEPDRVIGLDLGADDYIVKPFLPREFAARVRSALRRSTADGLRVVRHGDLEIRPASREVTLAGSPVALTRREFDLLCYLASRPGEVVDRQHLLQEVWGSSDEWQDSATVTEHVRRIRHKIEADPANPRWIQSVRNVGYRFNP